MANGKRTLTGSISSGQTLAGSVKGGSGTTDHSRLINRANEDQHPIEAITDLREELDSKLNSETALPLINKALTGKAKGLYFDAMKEFARKSYWYLTAEIDPKTGLGTKESIISGPYDLGLGGVAGGGGGVTTVTVDQVNWPTAATVGNVDNPTSLTINWTSVIGEDRKPTGVGTVYLIVNDRQVETRPKQAQGNIVFENISKYLVSGDNTIQVKVLDMYGTTGLTVGTITGVSLELRSTFNQDKAFYGKVDFTYTPIGDIAKKVYFIIDGDEANAKTEIITSSNELQTYTIYGLSHGAHTLKVYFEAYLGDQLIRSNALFYDITFVEENNPTPIIASEFNKFTQEQYISFNIPYRVFIDKRSVALVTFKVNGEVIRTSEVTTNGTHIWAYRYDDYTIEITEKGEQIVIAEPIVLEICCGTTVKQFKVAVLESQITVTPVLNNLELALSANGKSNEDLVNRELWSYTTTPPAGSIEEPKTYTCTFTDFNWKSDGWVLDKIDEQGRPLPESTTVLRVGGDARVEIPLEVFANNFTATGKTIELEISTHGIRNYESTIISCLDKEKTPFYTVEPLYTKEEERLHGYTVEYDYSLLSMMLTTPGEYLFTFKEGSWTREILDDKSQKITVIINLSDYGISIPETPEILNPDGDNLGMVLEGDRISVKFSMEARGFEITPQAASVRSQQSFLSTQYKEDEHVRVSFVVEPPDEDHNRIIWMYLNGVASGALQYPLRDNFQQKSPSYITIGSSEAIVDIYNIRIYNAALTNRQVVNNWIADTADAALKASRFNHNQVLNEHDQVTPASLLIGAPDLPYIIWDIDPLPQAKEDVRPGNARYVDPTDSTRNFTAIDAEYKVQGTSSAVYPTKNVRLRTKVGKGGPNLEWYDDDGNDLLIKNGGKGFAITNPNGIGVDYFTFKVDYASSEGANNVELTKLYNDASKTYGILTPPQKQDSRIRVGIDGFPIAAFQRDKNENLVFVTKANFNNDKGNPEVYGFEDGDESWETTNNSAAETKYQKPVTVENFAKGFEIRFPDKDGYNNMSNLGPMTEWVYSTYRYPGLPTEAEKDKAQPLPQPVTFKYGEATPAEDGSFTTTETEATFTHDTQEYRLTKFKAELKDWFNVDSCLFYYLFTELFLMIDSRAKNAFPTYYKSRKAGDGGDRWFWIPYDMDTAIGIDNKGKLTFDYYLEDTDQLYGADVYNGQTSVMWCNVRDAFKAELAAMYLTLRNQGIIDYDEVEKRFSEHQSKWPEVLLNLDAHNKYIVPLKNGDNYLEMLQGTKEQQRKWWLYNRFKYIDSKYNAGDAKADFIQFRAYVDMGQEKPDLVLTPYANIYATASFGNGERYTVSKRVKNLGESVTLENPFGLADDENDQETYIYSASQLKSIGDISGFHPDTVKIGNAIRLQDLKVGDASPNYKNPYLKELTVGANTLLKTLDARNCTNLGTGATVAPDLSKCTNIEEIYFTGTKIKGITLPDGGTIKKLYLPGTLTELTIQNQPLLKELYIENTNTTITKSAINQDKYSITGFVVKMDRWNESNANGNLYLADSLDEGAPQIRVSVADKAGIYDKVVAGESKITVKCTYIDARYDLIDNTEVQLAEYSTRVIESIFISTNDPTVSTVINVVKEKLEPPMVKDFKTSLIDTLWLEGIPAEAIKARDFIENMRPGTRVRLMGINETYNSWTEIKEFYDLLDRHYGINFNNTTDEPKAQVQGIINIDTIPYQKYIEFTTRYPDVKINAKQIICNVQFYNEGQRYPKENSTIKVALTTSLTENNEVIIHGKRIHAPLNPEKASTQSHYYTFEAWQIKKAVMSSTITQHVPSKEDGTIWEYNFDWGYETHKDEGDIPTWTEDYLVVADTRIDAYYSEHLQDYSVSFDTDSDLITVDDDHANLVVKYGSTITKPQPINVPKPVELDGWYTPQGTRWFFKDEEGVTPTQVLDHVVLKARWRDENEPSVTLIRQSYNTFRYQATDNLGIIKWAVVKGSDAEPTIWTSKQSTTTFDGNYVIDSAGEYYFWIADANGNKASQKIIAYPITVTTTPGITEDTYHFVEDDKTFVTTFALSGTVLNLVVGADEHYENVSVKIDPALGNSIDQFTVSQVMSIQLSCTPKDYVITFDLGGKGDITKAPEQIITYLHKVNKPLAQYHQVTGEVIDSWYTDPEFTNRWDFETSVVDYHTTLYAKWEAYHLPTVLTIQIPEGTDADRTILIAYSQYEVDNDHKVIIEWGDDTSYSSTESGIPLHPSHTYASGGTYMVKIHGTGGNTKAWYRLGDSWDYRLVTPSKYLIDIDFAWDISELAQYALYESSLTYPKISAYMSKISTGCYANCQNLQQITIPENITDIEDQAFSACSNASGTVKIPRSIQRIGHNAFDGCASITRFELLCDTDPTLFTLICRNCHSLKEIAISEHLTIPYQMFASSGLEEITINNRLDAQAFAHCSFLKKVISNSEYFGQQAFLGCTSLETVVLTNKNLQLDSYVFQDCPQLETFGPLATPINGKYTYDFNYAWDTEIPAYAFQRDWDSRHNIKSVTLPGTLKKIGALAFHNAVDLQEIILPVGLEEIGEHAFEACSSLSKMTIPGNVTNIGSKVFAGCTALTQVNIKARTSTTKVELPENSWFFNTNAAATIYVPNDLFDNVKDCYGLYWNFIKVNGTWQEIEYKSYTEPTT